MSFFPRWLLGAALLLLLFGIWLWAAGAPNTAVPPPAIEAARGEASEVAAEFPPIETLTAPWYRRTQNVARPLATQPSLKRAPADKTSVVFLGSYREHDGKETYFFKYVPMGRVIILKLGQSDQDWTLRAFDGATFTLLGPGGEYDVSR